MILRFLGSGDAFGSGGRGNTCFHVEANGVTFLIDCGASSLIAMKREAIDRNSVRLILVTHFHADHFGGIPFFMLDAQFFTKRREPLTIVGPPGLKKWYERVMETAFPGSMSTTPKFELVLREIAPGAPIELLGLTVSAFQANHGPVPDGPFVAYRITVDGKTIAYTGDTEWTDTLVDAGYGADLFIAEAYFRTKDVKYHLSLEQLERHLSEIAPRRLILTHMSDDMLAELPNVEWEAAYDGLQVVI